MEIELLIRWVKPKSRERVEAEKHHTYLQEKLGIKTDTDLEPENYDDVYCYDPMTFDVNDLARFHRVDNYHTTITFKDGKMYVAKIPYPTFQTIWEGLTMRRIMVINNQKLQEMQRNPIDY